MKSPGMSHNSYSEATALCATLNAAHSGPELATLVPDPQLAQELARTLLTDSFELTHSQPTHYATHGGFGGGMTIGLARR